MFELIKSGGWLMLPIILSSVVALAIIGERIWALQPKRVTPKNLVPQIWQWIKANQLNQSQIETLRKNSPLGRILAAGLLNQQHSREVIKESIEEAGRQEIHSLERYVNSLGTIASITPLLGLLGTVIGMIKVFSAITAVGVGNPAVLAGGIKEALYTTAGGLTVAIPAIIFYRYFRGRIEELVVDMENEAIKMVELLHHNRSV